MIQIESQLVDKLTKDIDSVEAVEKVLARANVVGVGIGSKEKDGHDTEEPCLKVLVSQKLPEEMLLSTDDLVPKTFRGTKTDVMEVGELFAGTELLARGAESAALGIPSPKPPRGPMRISDVGDGRWTGARPELGNFLDLEAGIQLLANRVRPAEGGYSVGHYQITAGTYATAVYDRAPFPGVPAKTYVLSNNHVLANSNNARVGDPILQPGPVDGGTLPADVIAKLSRWVTINFLPSTAPNYVDAAIAEGPFHFLDREIYWIGYVRGVRTGFPTVGEVLQKTGRTTNYTTGKVTAINATVNVNYGGGKVATFVRQIVTGAMSAGGDSGSLVLDMNGHAVGLLFAGSSSATILNRIDYVQSLLGIRIV